jgi:phosphonate transport system ATP-binding protein
MLRLDHLGKRFGQKEVIADVTVDIPPGQMVGVIGRSGAGKSTMLRLINRLAEPSSGTIRFGDVDVCTLRGRRLREWRAHCAMIFQQFNLVGRLDVLTNVMIGRLSYRGTLATLCKRFTAEDRARAIAALARFDLHEHALQRADTLSGGQQQRVAIARALVQEPQIVLADEPIASLDPRNARRVMDALRAINRQDGITVICNLHTLDTARAYCDRIIALGNGRIVFDGLPGALTNERAREIYGVEAEEAGFDEAITSTSLARSDISGQPVEAVA